jgi:hypothetical protein
MCQFNNVKNRNLNYLLVILKIKLLILASYGKPYNTRLYDSAAFKGSKYLILSTAGAFGGK